MTTPPSLADGNPYWKAKPLNPQKPPGILYHYTTTAGLMGIINNSFLWATDVRHLNDTEEFVFGHREVVKQLDCALKDRSKSDPQYRSRPRRDLPGGSYDEFLKVVGAAVNSIFSVAMCGVVCFCEAGDLLSQWRGYGGTLGYAIGFDSSNLAGIVRNEFIPLSPVCYLGSETSKRQEATSTEVRNTVKTHWNTWLDSAEGPDVDMTRVLMNFTALEMAMSAQIKAGAFREEQEWRIADVQQIGEEAIKFRQGTLGITPYLELLKDSTRGAPNLLPIKAITVGPGPAAATRITAVRLLLQEAGYDPDQIEVEGSKIPFRGF